MEELFRGVLDSLQDGISVSDRTGAIVYCNEALSRLSGIPRDTLLGSNVFQMVRDHVLPDTCNGRVIETKKPVSIINRWYEGRDCLLSGTPIFDENGTLQYAATLARDVSELQALRGALEKSNSLSMLYRQKLQRMTADDKEMAGTNNKRMQAVWELAAHVSDIDSTVLITGETGTGKDVLAGYIHRSGRRRNEPFLDINCGAIPEQLLESELFGYEAGAFTGANAGGKPGLFELAGHGTLFLDEIGDLSYPLQAKLLTVLQNRTIYRVGGRKPIKIHARIIAATNMDLETMMAEKKFRADLFYRLNVMNFQLPPLRERPEDIASLANFFLKDCNRRFQTKKYFQPELYLLFQTYSWPGNIREMKNLIERLAIISKEEEIGAGLFLMQVPHGKEAMESTPPKRAQAISLQNYMERCECAYLQEVLDRSKTLRQAADDLEIDVSTLVRKKKKYGL